MKYLAIIIARMGSTRLPGKVLMDICGKSVLERIIERVRRVPKIETIMIATTENHGDDPIADFCRENNILCYRGSENDVLDRIIKGSRVAECLHDFDYIIDLTADCPVVCPELIQKLIDKCELLKPHYASNIGVRSYCDGFDVQIAKKEVLYDVYNRVPKYHRCHSTWNVLAYADGISICNIVPPEQKYWMPEVGVTLDTPEDLIVIRRIYEYFADKDYVFNHYDVLELILAHPEILDVNKDVVRKIPGRDVS